MREEAGGRSVMEEGEEHRLVFRGENGGKSVDGGFMFPVLGSGTAKGPRVALGVMALGGDGEVGEGVCGQGRGQCRSMREEADHTGITRGNGGAAAAEDVGTGNCGERSRGAMQELKGGETGGV